MYEGQLFRRSHSFLDKVEDLVISGDGSKIFVLGSSCIQAVSIQTGQNVGRAEFRSPVGEGSSLLVRGSKVRVGDLRDKEWDFGGPEVSNFQTVPFFVSQ